MRTRFQWFRSCQTLFTLNLLIYTPYKFENYESNYYINKKPDVRPFTYVTNVTSSSVGPDFLSHSSFLSLSPGSLFRLRFSHFRTQSQGSGS